MAKSPRSAAQRAASRINGRKSAGPRTADGKSRSRRNALKHGLRASSLAMVAAVATPAAELAAAVRAELAPADVIEGELAEGIALAFWRLRRAREIEDALVDGRAPPGVASSLGRVLLRSGHAADALALLLRYRNQALGELARLRQLLELHRRPAAALAPEELDAPPPTPAGPANDNRPTLAALGPPAAPESGEG